MKFIDLLQMSLGNLARRKVRTALTVLGVLIGTSSVVTMISLGIGLNELTLESFDNMGSLKAIEVYSLSLYGDGASSGKDLYIKDETLQELRSIEHVESVSPILEVSGITMKQGAYEASVSIRGTDEEYLKGAELAYGTLPSGKDSDLRLFVGNNVITKFYNTKTKKAYAYSMNVEDLAKIDYKENGVFFLVFPPAEYDYQENPTSEEGEASTPPEKKYIANVSALQKGELNFENTEEWYAQMDMMYSDYIYANIDVFIRQLRKVYGKKAIPGQPTLKNGKPLSYITYSRAVVNVDNIDNVLKVQKEIKKKGFEAEAQMEWLEQSKSQAQTMQATLGGIGAVSLFVAAIGIANTMMMSIYERTKEIGIMKVLGCDMNKIRDMFLIESGFIGLIGGIMGVILSYMIAFAINKLGGAQLFYMEGDLARIPLWLSGISIFFAIIVGMLAGALPARRAMKLSPLAALRNE